MQKFTRDCLPALLDASFQPWESTQAVKQIATSVDASRGKSARQIGIDNQTIRRTLHRRQNEAETVSLTRWQINAVRASIDRR